MSILFTSDNGWIISHLDYLHGVYKTVQDEQETKTLNFNESTFKINSQYLRQSQINSYKNREDSPSTSRKRKRKNIQKLPTEILNQNNFIKDISEKLLEDAKHLKLFMATDSDNNEKSRLESKKFFLNRLESNHDFHGSNTKDTAIIAEFQNEKYVFPKNSIFYCYDIRQLNKKIKITDNFDLILLDPPWWNKSIRRKKMKFEESSYKMMYNAELATIPIGDLLAFDGIVAVWCTNSPSHMKSLLEEIFPNWGIEYKAKWYWLKITQNGQTVCDFNDVHGKQPYEQLILGTRSSNTNFNVPDKKIIMSVPSAIHSHKPPLTEILKSYLPNNPKCLEIFARYLLPGWTSWGLEVLKFQHLTLYTRTKCKNAPENNSTK